MYHLLGFSDSLQLMFHERNFTVAKHSLVLSVCCNIMNKKWSRVLWHCKILDKIYKKHNSLVCFKEYSGSNLLCPNSQRTPTVPWWLEHCPEEKLKIISSCLSTTRKKKGIEAGKPQGKLWFVLSWVCTKHKLKELKKKKMKLFLGFSSMIEVKYYFYWAFTEYC